MKIIDQGLLKFDYHLPIYNWIYPLSGFLPKEIETNCPYKIFKNFDSSIVQSRALYFHIPFCKKICTFCTFQRSLLQNNEVLEFYTRALICELKLKAEYKTITCVPISAIFFGGGTPSILSPNQIRRIGGTIKEYYDISKLSEFSVELGLSTITNEKLDAFREIGVTHARFGIQTFNPNYRSLFNLSLNLKPIYEAAEILPRYFSFVSFDMMYCFDGQSDNDFVEDIQKAAHLGISNIDYYPINNVSTQTQLHQAYKKAGLSPTPGLRKFLMNVLLREFMKSNGYLPHNGHGYVKVSNKEIKKDPVVTDQYTFLYHDHVYGYQHADVIGFGANAISSLNLYTLRNVISWERYINALLNNNTLEFEAREHDPSLDASKGLVLRLPYHGLVKKRYINWDSIHPETFDSLKKLIDAELVNETPEGFKLSRSGWYWYNNLMYYLSPKSEQHIIDHFIKKRYNEPERRSEVSEIPLLD